MFQGKTFHSHQQALRLKLPSIHDLKTLLLINPVRGSGGGGGPIPDVNGREAG